MSKKANTVVAVACAVAAALCMFVYLSGLRGEAKAAQDEALEKYGGQLVDVYVARTDIEPGHVISASDLEPKTSAAHLLPDGAIIELDRVVGRKPTSVICKGEVCVERRFEEGSSALEVPVGTAALSLPAKTVQALGGALKEGMRVDVYASGGSSTAAIARDVLVLATSAGGEGEGKGAERLEWVTLAVRPEAVQELVAASEKTKLCFVLPSDAEGASRDDRSDVGKEGAASRLSDAAPSVSGERSVA